MVLNGKLQQALRNDGGAEPTVGRLHACSGDLDGIGGPSPQHQEKQASANDACGELGVVGKRVGLFRDG